MKLLFDMTIPGIMRYIKNNEELSVPKYILSSYYPPSVPFKCHLWSVHVFVAKHKTFSLFFSKVRERAFQTSASNYGKLLRNSVLKTFILKSQNGAHQSSSENIFRAYRASLSGNVRYALF